MSDQPALYRPRHVVILAHPGARSFNALVAETYCATVRRHDQDCIVRNLYEIGFDPILKDKERPREGAAALSPDVKFELGVLRDSDVFVFVYPIWFGMPPAILKGYVDRVLGAGVTAQQIQQGQAATLMQGRRLVSITSSGTSKAWLNQQHQLDALKILFGDYLVKAFAMKSFENLHFGETVEGLAQDFIDPLLGQVALLADGICTAVVAERSLGSIAA